MRTTARLGCLSNSAIATALVIALVFVGVTLLRGGILFSPGALNAQVIANDPLGGVTSHVDIQDCAQCHPIPFSGVSMAERCLACHTDLKTDPQNFHTIMVAQGVKSGCTTCHTEHNGPNAAITRFDPNTFPHSRLGFSLKAHPQNADFTPFQCSGCHPNGYARYDQAVCASCHTTLSATFTQGHVAAFGQNCLACHDGVDSYGRAFNHAAAAFPLTGKHTSVACGQCHIAPASFTLAALKTTAQDCASCHLKDDPHGGNLGQNCAGCHATTGWTPSTFDHSRVAFALTGKHLAAACTACHVNGVLKDTPQDCASCHNKDDGHQGDLGSACGNCHTPNGWTPATIDHSLTRFTLVGKHLTVDCAACHVNNVFKGTPTICYSCHAKDDNHQGDLGQKCDLCHTPAGWLPASMDHNLTRFPLVGKHASVDCAACHVNNVYKGTPSTCYACHAKDDNHQGDLGQDCAHCHTPAGWLPATMDHNLTRFPLTGRHVSVDCAACHVNNVYKGTPTTCYACHAKNDAHNGQFGRDCGTCHSTAAWLPATFDHSRVGFPLTGAHAGLPCTSCHPNARFAGTPANCAACHAEPAYHQGLFGLNCAGCHTTSAWIPAKYNGAHTFPTSHGGSSTCRNCHPTTLAQWTCFKCHDQNQTIARHQQEGITNIGNCISCHPTGAGGDGGGGGN